MRRSFRILAGVLFVTVFFVAGCEPDNQLQIKPAQTGALERPASQNAVEPDATKLSDLAAQSQRDVDLILRSRAANSNPDVAGTTGSTPPAPRKPIVWNERPNAATAAAGTPAPAGQQTPTSINAASPASSPETTRPASLEPDRLKSLVVDLSRELYASGSYSTTPLRELLTIAAMSMIDPQRTLDPQAIPDLTDKERELLGHLQAFFAELGKSLDSPGRDTEEVIVDAVGKLRETLVKPPSLQLLTATLCTRVGGFGDYSPFEKNTFLAQNQQKAIVYLEIDDFTSVLNKNGEYVTQLAQQLTIYSDRDGIPVWKEDWQTVVDTSKNKRQDFFTVQVITLPKALTVGKYQLKIRARDEQSQAEAETSITFELVADPRLVGK